VPKRTLQIQNGGGAKKRILDQKKKRGDAEDRCCRGRHCSSARLKRPSIGAGKRKEMVSSKGTLGTCGLNLGKGEARGPGKKRLRSLKI